MEKTTLIRVSVKTKKVLESRATYGMTMDDVIRILLKEVEGP